MWSIRILSGKMAGQFFQLKNGSTTIGRAPNCDIVINSQSVSKEHARIEVIDDKVILTDLGSRNGTFVNGVQVRSQKVHSGDKIALNDIIVELSDKAVQLTPRKPKRPALPRESVQFPAAPPMQVSYDGNNALQASQGMGMPVGMSQQPSATPEEIQSGQAGIAAFARNYIDNVVMPGIYKLPEWMEFRWVIALFTLSFVVTVTCLSAIPLTRILKDSVERESQNRAKTIARNLADRNRGAIQQGLVSAMTTEFADNEPGVDRAYIISQATGEILAPPNLAGRVAEETFVNAQRKFGKEHVEQIDDSTVGVLVPIAFMNPTTGSASVQANAVVIYNMGTLAVSGEKTLALLVQVLFLALFFGAVLYYFLVRLIEYPIVQMNHQVKSALTDGKSQVVVPYLFPQLQDLASNVNNAIQRAMSGDLGGSVSQNYEYDRSNEINGILNVIPAPAAAVNPKDLSFIATNSYFTESIARGADWSNTKIEAILEQSLRLNLSSLLDTANQDAMHSAQDELEVNNVPYTLHAQGVYGSKELSYVIIIFNVKGT